jgi:hypothetical protein
VCKLKQTKWLLANNGSGTLVIEIQIANGISQHAASCLNETLVLSKNGTSQPVWSEIFDASDQRISLIVRINVSSHDRAKDFLNNKFIVIIIRKQTSFNNLELMSVT